MTDVLVGVSCFVNCSLSFSLDLLSKSFLYSGSFAAVKIVGRTRVLAEWQNASYDKSVSRVRIPTPVDHVTTACPKSVCEQTLKIPNSVLRVGSA